MYIGEKFPVMTEPKKLYVTGKSDHEPSICLVQSDDYIEKNLREISPDLAQSIMQILNNQPDKCTFIKAGKFLCEVWVGDHSKIKMTIRDLKDSDEYLDFVTKHFDSEKKERYKRIFYEIRSDKESWNDFKIA